MLDRYYKTTSVGASYPQKITVTENKAPTDDSVKLLREMERKAEDNMLDSVIINDNILNGVSVMSVFNVFGGRAVHIRFKLNGKDYHVKEVIDDLNLVMLSRGELYKMLYEAAAKEISREIIIHAIESGIDIWWN